MRNRIHCSKDSTFYFFCTLRSNKLSSKHEIHPLKQLKCSVIGLHVQIVFYAEVLIHTELVDLNIYQILIHLMNSFLYSLNHKYFMKYFSHKRKFQFSQLLI